MQGPSWGYFKSQFPEVLSTFRDISPRKRTTGSKNEPGIPHEGPTVVSVSLSISLSVVLSVCSLVAVSRALYISLSICLSLSLTNILSRSLARSLSC